MKRSLMKVQAVFCAGVFAAASGGCNDLIGLEVGETNPTEASTGASSSSSAGGSSTGDASGGGSSAVGSGAGGRDDGGGSGAGAPTCGEASGAALVEASGLWGDTLGEDVGGVAALDDEVTTVVNATGALTVARWSSSGARQSEVGLSASGFRGTHLAVAPGVTVVAGESLGGAGLSGACAVGSNGGGGQGGGAPSFVAALDAAGQCAWAWSLESDGGTTARGVAATSDAVLFAVESVGKGKSYGPCAMRPGVPQDAALIAALDPATGACRWHRSLGEVTTLGIDGEQRVEPLGAAQLPDGDVVIAGRYAGSLDLEDTCPGMPDAGNTDNVFVARVSEHGAVWSRGFGDTTAAQTATGVAVDGAGSVHVAGVFSGELDVGSAGKLTAPAGRRAGFLIKLDANGNLVSASRLDGDTADLRIIAAGKPAGGPLYVAGSLTGPLDLGGVGGLLGAGTSGFIARLSEAP
ncbi:hypothetical protein AB3662_31600 [Sorangium cellulosum]|uniref:hypothetical protein n=1 Tax=Sorangium cellulosum TaxID=56 RepID=UPI003D9AA498